MDTEADWEQKSARANVGETGPYLWQPRTPTPAPNTKMRKIMNNQAGYVGRNSTKYI